MKIKNSGGTVLQEVSYRYDPLDRRIGAGTNADGAGSGPMTWQWTVYDGQNPYADFDNSGSLTNRYVSGDAADQLFGRMSSSGTTAWYLTDQLGSVRDIANTSGTLIDEVSYDSFGKVLSESSPTNGDRFKFTGRELDATTKQYYYRARQYDPATGRFLSEDPIGFASGDTNVHRYVGNSPANATDPGGLKITYPVAPPAELQPTYDMIQREIEWMRTHKGVKEVVQGIFDDPNVHVLIQLIPKQTPKILGDSYLNFRRFQAGQAARFR